MQAWVACLFALCLLVPASGQQAVQFLPDDVPALASNITQRLIYRASGLRQFWDDQFARTARLQIDIVLDNASWHSTFDATGGVAELDPNRTGATFRITSGMDDAAVDGSMPRPQLDFDAMSATFHVKPGGLLAFDNIMLSNIAPTFAYQPTPWAPWRNAGVGYPLWPSIIMSDNGTVVLRNVSVNYVDPSGVDIPEQYNAKVVFGLRQQYGAGNISLVNATAARVHGPLTIRVLVLNGSTNGSSNENNNMNSTGVAYAIFENVTFNCEPWRNGTTAGISPSARAAAIAVPVVVGTVLLAGVAAWLCIRRRRKQRAAQPKDVEAGQQHMHELADVAPASDQRGPRQGDQGALYVAAGPGDASGLTPGGSSSGVDFTQESSDNSAGSCGTHPSLHTPPVIALNGAAGMASSSMESQDQGAAAAGGAAATCAGAQFAAAAGAAAAAVFPSGAPAGQEGYAVGSGGSSGGQYWHNASSAGRQQSCNSAGGASYSASAGMAETSSGCSVGLDRVSTGRLTPGTLAQGLQHPLSSNCSFEVGSPGTVASPAAGASPIARRSTGTAAAAAAEAAAAAARGSAGSTPSTRSARSSTPRGPGASSSGGACSELGSLTSGSRAMDRAAGGMSALIKARSDVALLRDLKIGPLLGRGSYGRVYKGRWKAVTVAVKIIEHSEGSPGSASSGGKRISAGREMLVATNISHPNVVQTYHISTMTVAQRNALAAAWLKEGGAGSSSGNSAAHMVAAAAARQATADEELQSGSSNGSDGSDEQSEALETWMVLEFCEKGSMQRALSQGRFKRRDSQQPDMIGVYKALLDTASGLDYLHSIGVVHGDLKTCNVLLKGSARDVRGFCCKIADFGLSRVLDMDATHISTRTYGTIVYMPSELLLSGRMTTATDIYSFGLMMWELLTSQPVFEEGMSIGQMFYMVSYQNWRPTVPPDCPPGYAQLMTACWHQDPEQRPKVQQLLRSLQKLYVGEKQRIVAAKSTADSPLRTNIDSAGGAADYNRPAAASAPAAAPAVAPAATAAAAAAAAPPVSPMCTAAARVPAAVTTQPSAATDWARAAAVAAAARAAFGTADDRQQQQHQQRQGQATSDRTSFESTGSDRYQNAASAASEPSMMVGGLPPWHYPGQLSQAPAAAAAEAAAPAISAGAAATPSPATGSYGSSSTLPDTPAAAAAAAARGRTGGESGPPSTVDTYPHSRRSYESSRGSANAEGGGLHSAGTDGQEQYEPWAKAVSQDGVLHSVAGHGHGQGVDRQRSMTLLDVLAEGWPAPAAGTQQQQQQQEQQQQQQQRDQQPGQQRQQVHRQNQQQEDEQQQQAQLELMIQQAFSAGNAPAATSINGFNSGGYAGDGGQQYSRMEIGEGAEDTEPIEDTIPSESLFSSTNNAVFKDAGEEIASGALYQDTAGFISGLHRRRSSQLMQHQIQQLQQQLQLQQQRAAVRPVGQAAQGFLDAIESVASYRPTSAGIGRAGASSSSGGGQGYQRQYQQQQQQQEDAHRFSVEFVPYMPAGTLAPQQQQQLSSEPQQGPAAAAAAALGSRGWAGSQQPAAASNNSSNWGVSPSMAAYLQAPTAAGSVGLAAHPIALQAGPETHSGSFAVIGSRLYTAGAPGATYTAPVPASGPAGTAASIPGSAGMASPFSAAQAEPRPAAASAIAPASPAAGDSPFAQAQPAAAVGAPSPVIPPAAGSSSSHPAGAAASPFAAAAAARPSRPPPSAAAPRSLSRVSGGSGSSNIASPDRERVFMYRTPSGRVINPPFSMMQTVRESSGSSGRTGSLSGAGSKGSGPDSSRASSGPEQQQLLLQAQAHSQLQRQQRQGEGAAGPPPSPFALLAQRAGSLFGPT